MSVANPLLEIPKYGQSIWMDNLSRNLIVSGELQRLITARGICGITSNPTIFQKAIAGNAIYDADIVAGAKAGLSVEQIYESLVFKDIQDACDIFRPIYDASQGVDGYVSIEVPPQLARDTEGTVREALRYFQTINRPNVMIKIPGTPEGLVAVERVIAAGVNVNITLLFSVQSYVETAWAYIRGLEARVERGEPIDRIASVASFFLSRIDTKVDKLLEAIGTDEAKALMGKTAIANAKVAYERFQEILAHPRWQALAAQGAKVQRLLWASTSTKNPQYSDVMYVEELVGANTVNTLPPETIEACADHCKISDHLRDGFDQAEAVLAKVQALGIDLDKVMAELLEEGIQKFIEPFESLMNSLRDKVAQLTPA
ncbi:MAG: transaldolase [Gloeomargarita sp. SKYG116]|nr:transaldolase [Gloeomargarita sp. SKYG116]MCS7226051.1 transaldolase [Gloeomargarita sp. SKYB31]MDW8400964.1 transaldolase [Gloeomargarita sp. SKYGB_i_bin116]